MEQPETCEAAKAHIRQIRKAKGFSDESDSIGTWVTDDLEASLSM